MMASMGAVNESTVVVTVVHDCQVSLLTHIFIYYLVTTRHTLSS